MGTLMRPFFDLFVPLLVLGLGVFLVVQALLSYRNNGDVFADTGAQLRECLKNPELVVTCAQREVLKLLDGRSGSAAMALLAEMVPPGQCHTLGHTVGQEVYKRSGNLESSIAECGYGCTGSCVHGVIGAALIAELGLDEGEVDPQHLDPEYIEAAGKKMCAKRSTCHAVGHILFQIYNEFEKPLAICENISSGGEREHCYRGVFMEQADDVSTHNLLLGTERKKISDAGNLRFPCDSVADKHSHACFRYLPRVHESIFDEMNVSKKDRQFNERRTCESFSGVARSSCFEGYGFNYYGLVRSDTGEAYRVCSELSLENDRTACSLGMIYPVADNGDVSVALTFCKAIGEEAQKNMCYHGALEAARLRTSPALSIDELRGACRGEEECLGRVERYSSQPWDTVFGVR